MKKEIKECPFCGFEWAAVRYDPETNIYYVECDRCLSRGAERKTKEEAKSAWNKRAKMTVEEHEELQWLDKPMWPNWDD